MPDTEDHDLPSTAALERPAQAILALSEQLLAADLPGEQRATVEAILETAYRWLDESRARRASPARGPATAQPFSLRDLLAFRLGDALREARLAGTLVRVEIESDAPDALAGDADALARALGSLIEWAAARGHEARLRVEPEFIAGGKAALGFSIEVSERRDQPARTAPPDVQALASLDASLSGSTDRLAFSARFVLRQAGPPRSITAPRQASLAGLPVLLALDREEQRAQLAELLADWGVQPVEADGADMAVALLERAVERGRPMVAMLFGPRLAGHDGFFLALRVKRHPTLASTGLILLTAEGRRGDAMRCREFGIEAYLPEPASAADLREALATILGVSTHAGDDAPTLVTRHSLREQRDGGQVLLAGAERDTQVMAAHVLEQEGASLVLAESVAGASELLARQPFDLVLVVTTPDEADEAIEALAESGGAGMPPVVALLGEPDDATRMLLELAGYAEVLALPLSSEALRGLVRRQGRQRAP